jgi:ribA/ribD-fused uncharacterized protein
MTFNKAWLTQTYPDPKNIPFFFFWGHQPSADGRITKSCLSQWWVAPFEVKNIIYQTAEHWMMAEKARLFKDGKAMANILASQTPAKAKEEGRLIENFDPAVWDLHKFDIVVDGNRYKFSSDRALKDFLLATGQQVLVEASPLDTIWGIGLSGDNPAARDPRSWRGENLLGFALMEVRAMLMNAKLNG